MDDATKNVSARKLKRYDLKFLRLYAPLRSSVHAPTIKLHMIVNYVLIWGTQVTSGSSSYPRRSIICRTFEFNHDNLYMNMEEFMHLAVARPKSFSNSMKFILKPQRILGVARSLNA